MLEHYLKSWQLTVSGEIIYTPSSQIIPVVMADNTAAILKLTSCKEEQIGHLIMCWWHGLGAAKVFAHHQQALLLEKAHDKHSLLTMSLNGEADQATTIICNTIKQLHTPRKEQPPSQLISLHQYFSALLQIAQQKQPTHIFSFCAQIATELLNTQSDITVLHGDIHHRNILQFERGWLAIDPKCVIGERGFDYANLLCNPELAIANQADFFVRQLNNTIALSGIASSRLLKWVIAHAGLSAAWFVEDNQLEQARFELSIAKLAIQQLDPALLKTIEDF